MLATWGAVEAEAKNRLERTGFALRALPPRAGTPLMPRTKMLAAAAEQSVSVFGKLSGKSWQT
jgi:hypothetical protein